MKKKLYPLVLVFMLLFSISYKLQAQCNTTFTWSQVPGWSGDLNFTADTSNLNTATTSFDWRMDGNSFPFTQNNPTAIYYFADSGLHVVCLIITDTSIGCSATYCDTIWVGNGSPCGSMTSNMTYWADTAAINIGLCHFSPQTTGGYWTGGYTYSWNFGDGNTSTAASPSHQYLINQSYLACVTVTDTAGCVATSCDSIYPYNPCANNNIQISFTKTINTTGVATFVPVIGSGTPIAYTWNFGDGATSNLASPSHQYSYSTNNYQVSLSITYSHGCTSSYTAIVYLPSPCYGWFSWQLNNDTSITFFADTSMVNIPSTTYSWSYGDGSTGIGGPINTHQYNAIDMYSVCLTTSNSVAGCSQTACDSVETYCVGFNPSYSTIISGNNVTFNSVLAGGTPPYSYYWSFGDGEYGSGPTPTHLYQDAATAYGAVLWVSDSFNCSAAYLDTIVTDTPCLLNQVTLYLGFDNYAAETSWDLRDSNGVVVFSGQGSSGQSNNHLQQTFCLPTGCYTFNLYDSYGDGICCLYGQGHYYLTDDSIGMTLASGGAFGYSETTSFCVGGATNACTGFAANFQSSNNINVVSFTASSNRPSVEYLWNFGDNTTDTGSAPIHTYSSATGNGYYTVCVTAIDTLTGCHTTYCDYVAVAPPPCSTNTVIMTLNFDNFAHETSWTLTDLTGTVLYSNAGQYYDYNNGTTYSESFCLPAGCYNFNIYDSYGDGICCDWGQGSYSLQDTLYNILASGASFTHWEQTSFCVGGVVNPCAFFGNNTFIDSIGADGFAAFTPQIGGQSPFNYHWNFDNGTTSTLVNPTVTFLDNGIYNVCLTVDSAACTTTYCKNIVITNADPPCPGISAYINMIQDSIYPFSITMQAVVNNAPANTYYNVAWDFGDKPYPFWYFDTVQTHYYTNFGSFVVCLAVTNQDTNINCVTTYCDTITIDSAGNFSRNLNYKDIKPGFLVQVLPPNINYTTAVQAINTEEIFVDLFPNPADKFVNLMLHTPKELNGTINIINTIGQTVYQQNLNAKIGQQQIELPIHQLVSGVYLVQIASGELQKTMKFVKE